jgi:hypothetical protein
MDQILDNIVKALDANLKKEGKVLDAKMKIMIRESLKNQFANLPEDKRYEVLGLIASQLRVQF